MRTHAYTQMHVAKASIVVDEAVWVDARTYVNIYIYIHTHACSRCQASPAPEGRAEAYGFSGAPREGAELAGHDEGQGQGRPRQGQGRRSGYQYRCVPLRFVRRLG